MKAFNFYARLFIIMFITVIMSACKKDTKVPDKVEEPESTTTSVTFSFIPKNGAQTLLWDSISNTNAAGNQFSVNTINLYISNVWLKHANGSIFKSNQVFYIDTKIASKSTFQLSDVPKGDYVEVQFLLGLDTIKNVDNGLETTMDNLNMAWPTMMGGGYHFIKMEGHYLDGASVSKGYAVHLGKNENLVQVTILKNLSFPNASHQCSISFDVNEAFTSPYLYDLNAEANYTMSDSIAMSHIKTNLQDAFNIIQNN